jgi:hypothetical protein
VCIGDSSYSRRIIHRLDINKTKSKLFCYHKNGSKKLNAYSLFFLAWFIFNLNTESHYLQITYYGIYTSGDICSNPPPCFLLSFSLTYLENQLFCSWCEYPSTLVPGLLTTAHPLLVLPPFHTPTDQVTIFT